MNRGSSAPSAGCALHPISEMCPVLLLNLSVTLFLGEGLSGDGGHWCVCLWEWGGRKGRVVTQSSICMKCVAKASSRREGQWVCCVCVPVQVCENICPSSWNEDTALGAHTSKCQKQGRLHPGTAAGCESPAAGEPHIHLPQQTCTLLSREGRRMREWN